MTPLHFLIKYNIFEYQNDEEMNPKLAESKDEEDNSNKEKNEESQKKFNSDKTISKGSNNYYLNQVIFKCV
jgi:hypothetical protein